MTNKFDLNEAYISIAQSVYDLDIGELWEEAICTFSIITKSLIGQVRLFLPDGTVKTKAPSSTSVDLAMEVREVMAESHPEKHAWYTMMVKVTATGAYEFTFDYDHLPAFKYIPDPEEWAHEFATYPRPDLQVHVQDWMDGIVGYKDYELIRKRLRALSPIVWIDAVNDD